MPRPRDEHVPQDHGATPAGTVTSRPTSNSNRGACYARAEYLDSRGRRRVLVWQADPKSAGRRGFVSLRDGLGATDLPGTRKPMSGHDLLHLAVRIEATGEIEVGGDRIVFPSRLKDEFVARCRARMEEARSGALSKSDPFP